MTENTSNPKSGRSAAPDDTDPVQGFSPAGQLLTLISGYWTTQAIYVAAELGIADLLGRKSTPVEELACLTRTHTGSLYRVLRALASVGIFSETQPRAFSLTAMGVLLRNDTPGNLRAFSRFQGEVWHWGCWGDILHSVRTGEPSITHQQGAADCFDYLGTRPASAQLFSAAMAGYTAQIHAALVDTYDFADARLIIDIGGGNGTLLAEILIGAPHARGILFDVPSVVADSTAIFANQGVSQRTQGIAGDFFEAVPQGGDVYVLSNVLHDWPDERACLILRNIESAMSADARILIVENVIPDNDAPHPGKFVDLEMLLIARGRERTQPEFNALLHSCALRIERIIPTGAPVSIVEARHR